MYVLRKSTGGRFILIQVKSSRLICYHTISFIGKRGHERCEN